MLFDDTAGRRLRTWLMDLCNLHTILRLPTGIFYAQSVRTNVMFLHRGLSDKTNTEAVWVYDLRANMPAFGRTKPLRPEDFQPFIAAHGSDPLGTSPRIDEGPAGRFRCFSRGYVADREEKLNIAWLKDDSEDPEGELTDPDDLALARTTHLRAALDEIEGLCEDLPQPRVEVA